MESPPAPVFVRVRRGRNRWVVDEDRVSILDRVGEWGYQEWRNGQGVELIQEPTTRLALLVRPDPESPPLFVKVSRFIRLRKRIRSLFRPTDSDKDWEGSLAAWSRGLPTPRPLALGERRQWGMLEETYFITEAVMDSQPSLNLFGGPPEVVGERAWIGRKRDFIRLFAELVRHVQDENILHRQLGPLNILVPCEFSAPLALMFTDNKHLEVRKWVTEEDRVQNLVRTYYQWLAYLPGKAMRPVDLFRFIRDYRREGPLASDKELFRAVMAEVYRQADRYAHRGMIPPLLPPHA